MLMMWFLGQSKIRAAVKVVLQHTQQCTESHLCQVVDFKSLLLRTT